MNTVIQFMKPLSFRLEQIVKFRRPSCLEPWKRTFSLNTADQIVKQCVLKIVANSELL